MSFNSNRVSKNFEFSKRSRFVQVRNSRKIFAENEEDSIDEYIWTYTIKINKCLDDDDCIVIFSEDIWKNIKIMKI